MGKKQKKRQESDLDEVLLGVPPLRGVNKTDPEYNALPPIGDDPVGKLICDLVVPFKDVPRELWVQFEDLGAYRAKEQAFLDVLREKWESHET